MHTEFTLSLFAIYVHDNCANFKLVKKIHVCKLNFLFDRELKCLKYLFKHDMIFMCDLNVDSSIAINIDI